MDHDELKVSARPADLSLEQMKIEHEWAWAMRFERLSWRLNWAFDRTGVTVDDSPRAAP